MAERAEPLPESKASTGPYRADQFGEDDRCEVSDGHAIYCAPCSSRHGRANLTGAAVLETDPAVAAAGLEIGFSPDPLTLRAPDVAVGDLPDRPGWAPGVPPLAVEYADTGQDEADLRQKIRELLAAGTRYLWVVRLVGPRRVEVYHADGTWRLVDGDGVLTAPGVLQNPVPVAALYDRNAAHEQILQNLLQRLGYHSLEAVEAESRHEGLVEGRREGRREGLVEGRREGRREGLVEGRREGLVEGQQETLARLVRHMTELGRSPSEIAELIGSSPEEVERLRDGGTV